MRGILGRKLELFVMRREEEGAGHRHQRVQSLILDELRALLRDDVFDPALADVRITTVVLSVDYRHARIHFSVASGNVSRGTVERALLRATPFLRARLADAVEMKRVPDLRFVFDGVAPPNDGGAPCIE
ncbi:MAG: ribosome-binding factor A [Polyangiaceae bacterium]|nr:ribosome-binding factor A [Polyangiaceae bacterium]